MAARFLARLDDACPTMRREAWAEFERLLDASGVKPIVAVVPANRDPALALDAPDPAFWERVRGWQAKGWTVALHGFDHVYVSTAKGLVPFHRRSEFASLPLDQQREKIRNGVRILRDAGVQAEAWVAPSHSFDRNTLRALEQESTIRVVSDGLAWRPFERHGFFWVPQQLWRFRPMPFGVWTCCFHPNTSTRAQLDALEKFLAAHKAQFAGDLGALRREFGGHPQGLRDRLFEAAFLALFRLRRAARRSTPA